MRLGIVSDTHGHVENARRAAQMLESFAVDRVVHCGDIGSRAVVGLFAAWPTHFVVGNVDSPNSMSAAVEKAGQTWHGAFGSLDLEGVKIAFLHGDDQRLLQQTVAEGQYQLVCHGHTHQATCQRVGKTMVLNPGALYRAVRHTIAIVELPALTIEIIEV